MGKCVKNHILTLFICISLAAHGFALAADETIYLLFSVLPFLRTADELLVSNVL